MREVPFQPGAAVIFQVALEIQGGVYVRGRHTRGRGYERDCEKLAEAQLLGWTVIYATPGQIENGVAITWLKRALAR